MENGKYKNVYTMTNENLGCLSQLYDFDHANVLTVLGSGDQYFTSLLNGAKDVSVFDINETAWLYFRIKFKAIRILSYDEFITLFVNRRFSNIDIYNKLYRYLSPEELSYYCTLASNYDDYILGVGYFEPNTLKHNAFMWANKEKFIPYLDEDTYYKLQTILNHRELPQFHLGDFVNMEVKLGFDILLLSNIFDYCSKLKISDFKKLIMQYDATYTLARYSWHYELCEEKFKENGFIIDEVLGIKGGKNYIASYKKKVYTK